MELEEKVIFDRYLTYLKEGIDNVNHGIRGLNGNNLVNPADVKAILNLCYLLTKQVNEIKKKSNS